MGSLLLSSSPSRRSRSSPSGCSASTLGETQSSRSCCYSQRVYSCPPCRAKRPLVTHVFMGDLLYVKRPPARFASNGYCRTWDSLLGCWCLGSVYSSRTAYTGFLVRRVLAKHDVSLSKAMRSIKFKLADKSFLFTQENSAKGLPFGAVQVRK